MNLTKGIGMIVVLFCLSFFFLSGEAQEKRGIGKTDDKKPRAEKGLGFTASRDPIDIAYGILYLASDESRFVNGSELVIAGGWTAK